MATTQSTADFIVEQAAAAGALSARKMFGEYGLFLDGTMIALICDDQLFVKPTAAGRALIGAVVEASPYPGAKPCFVIDGDHWDDASWMAALFAATAAELPAPKPKRPQRRARPSI